MIPGNDTSIRTILMDNRNTQSRSAAFIMRGGKHEQSSNPATAPNPTEEEKTPESKCVSE